MQNITITKPNTKGQIVLPKKLRDELGIGPETMVEITKQGRGIYVAPLGGSGAGTETNQAWIEVLKRTQGAWGPETTAEKKQRLQQEKYDRLEIKKMREAW